MNLARALLSSALLSTSLLLAACGGTSSGSNAQLGSCSLAPATFKTTIASIGQTVTETFATNGVLSATFSGGAQYNVTSAWTLNGNTLTLNDTGGSLACPNNQTGVYTLAFTSDCKSFTMTAVSDPCSNGGTGAPHRKEELNGSVWTRQ